MRYLRSLGKVNTKVDLNGAGCELELSGLNGFQGGALVSTVMSIVILIKTGLSCVAKRLSASRNNLCEVFTKRIHVPFMPA